MATAFLGLPTVTAGTLIKASDWNSMVNKIDAAIKKIMVVEHLYKFGVITTSSVTANSETISLPSATVKGYFKFATAHPPDSNAVIDIPLRQAISSVSIPTTATLGCNATITYPSTTSCTILASRSGGSGSFTSLYYWLYIYEVVSI